MCGESIHRKRRRRRGISCWTGPESDRQPRHVGGNRRRKRQRQCVSRAACRAAPNERAILNLPGGRMQSARRGRRVVERRRHIVPQRVPIGAADDGIRRGRVP